MPDLMEAMDKYTYGHLRDLRKRAASTVTGAEQSLGPFVKWMAVNRPDVTSTKDLTADHFGDFLATQWDHLSDNSYNLYVGYLGRWVRFMGDEGWLTIGRSVGRKILPRDKPLRKKPQQFLRQALIEDLAKAAGRWHPRDEYYIRLSYGLWRRYSEISAMRVGDIDFSPRPHRPFGTFTFDDQKNRDQRVTLALSEEAARDARKWFEIYAAELKRMDPERKLKPTDYLIPAIGPGRGAKTIKGERKPVAIRPTKNLPYTSAWTLLVRAQEIAGWDGVPGNPGSDHPEAHGMRRGGVDDLIFATGDIRIGQTAANHATQKTTEVYTDRRRAADDLGDALGRLGRDEQGASQEPATEELPSNVTSLADALERKRRRA